MVKNPVDDIRIRSLIEKLLEKASPTIRCPVKLSFYFLRIADYQYCLHDIFMKRLVMN